jgi:hypothetical protein
VERRRFSLLLKSSNGLTLCDAYVTIEANWLPSCTRAMMMLQQIGRLAKLTVSVVEV